MINLRDKYGRKIKDKIEVAKIVIASTLLYEPLDILCLMVVNYLRILYCNRYSKVCFVPTKTFMTQRRPSPGCGYMSASGEIPVIVLTEAIRLIASFVA